MRPSRRLALGRPAPLPGAACAERIASWRVLRAAVVGLVASCCRSGPGAAAASTPKSDVSSYQDTIASAFWYSATAPS